jgi:hypothetical protein
MIKNISFFRNFPDGKAFLSATFPENPPDAGNRKDAGAEKAQRRHPQKTLKIYFASSSGAPSA